MPDTRSRLRNLLNGPEMVVAPFVYDCLQARLAQRDGFKAIYMTGFGTAAARGFLSSSFCLWDGCSMSWPTPQERRCTATCL